METKEFIRKISAIEWKDYSNKTFYADDWQLRYRFTISKILGLQIIFNLYYKENSVQSWGFTHEDNDLAANWILNNEMYVDGEKYKTSEQQIKTGKELFKNI